MSILILIIDILCMILTSCVTSDAAPPVSVSPVESRSDAYQGLLDNEFSLEITNPTIFDVYFEGGQKVEKKSRGKISLYSEQTTLTGGFDIVYEIPLSDKAHIFCKGDHQTIRETQTIFTVNEPRLIENYGTYIKIINQANNAVSFYTGGIVNPGWEQRGSYLAGNHITWTDKREFSPGETGLFNISSDTTYDQYAVRDGRRNIPLNLPKVERNYLYEFVYSPQGLTLTDARPLHSIGEPSWTKTVTGISAPATLAAEGEGIIVTPSGDYEITAAYSLADGSLLTAGFTNRNGGYSPLARKEGPEGVTRWELPPSRRADSRFAYYLALTRGSGDLWLASGGADTGINEAAGFKAYIRCFRDSGASADIQWELGPDDFAERYGAVKSAVWDAAGNRFLVTGDFLDPEGAAAYTASIDGGGTISSVDAGFVGFSFSKILAAPDGAYYLIGEEQKADASYAVMLKYNAQGQRLWRTAEQPGPFSYYQDAVLDETGEFIVLAGAMNASDQYGGEGTPFVEGINAETGKREWLTALNDPAFAGTSLAAGLVKAPGYGYIVSLAGIAAANYRPPFMIARVNALGRLFN